MRPIFTFPYWGNYTILFQTLLEKLGLEVIPPQITTSRDIEEGAKISPELFCLPFKVNLGNYLAALRKGANTILMWENVRGICRLRYYWLTQEKVLRDLGFEVKVLNLNGKNFFSRIKEIKKETKISFWQIISALLFALKELSFIEKLEKRASFFRPREENEGETDKVLTEILEELKRVKNFRDLFWLQKKAWQKFSEIKINKNKEVLKIGLLGEIYTVVDGAVNFDLERKLGKMGAETHREMSLSYFLKGVFPWRDWLIEKAARPYLKSTVGGHGRDAVAEMLSFVKKGFDGVIQLLPLSCMPEVTVRPILQKISQEKKIPFLSLSLDEQTGEAGIQTRLEAFVDLMKSKYQKQLTINN